jgi:hypothetical protein
VTGSKTPDPGVKNAMLKALHEVVSKAGANMSDASRQSVLGLIDGDADGTNGESIVPRYECNGLTPADSMAISHARLVGALVKNLPPSNASTLLKYSFPKSRYEFVLTVIDNEFSPHISLKHPF